MFLGGNYVPKTRFLPIGEVRHTTLSHTQSTHSTQQVVEWIRELLPNAEDTIRVYYTGHSVIDTLDKHYLNELYQQNRPTLRMLLML